MPQMSKILNSRDEWKSKAVKRAEANRELRKIKKRHQERIRKLKAQLSQLRQATLDKKTQFNPVVEKLPSG